MFLHSLKLTVRRWKMVIGRLFPCRKGYFQGRTVSFGEGKQNEHILMVTLVSRVTSFVSIKMAIFGKLSLAPNQRSCSSQLNWHILARNGKCSKQMKDCVGGVIFRWLKGSKLCPENGPTTMSIPRHPQGMMFKGSKKDILLANKFLQWNIWTPHTSYGKNRGFSMLMSV